MTKLIVDQVVIMTPHCRFIIIIHIGSLGGLNLSSQLAGSLLCFSVGTCNNIFIFMWKYLID